MIPPAIASAADAPTCPAWPRCGCATCNGERRAASSPMLPPAPPIEDRIAAEMSRRMPGRTPVVETEEDVAGGRGEWTASVYIPGNGFARAFYADTVASTRDAALSALASALGIVRSEVRS